MIRRQTFSMWCIGIDKLTAKVRTFILIDVVFRDYPSSRVFLRPRRGVLSVPNELVQRGKRSDEDRASINQRCKIVHLARPMVPIMLMLCVLHDERNVV